MFFFNGIIITLGVLFVVTSVSADGVPAANCIVSNFDHLSRVQNVCSHIIFGNVTVPDDQILVLDLKSGSSVTFRGTITFGYTPRPANFLFTIKGENLTVQGEPGSLIDGQGPLYWKGDAGKNNQKPYFLRIETTGNSVFRNISLLNCPKNCVKILSSDLALTGWNIDCSAGDQIAHNTDGFDINSGTNIIVENSIVRNQDDCVAVNQGSNMVFSNLFCSGGHGLSLSVGFNKTSFIANTVTNVTFSNCTVVNSANGIHVKTHADSGFGQISGVTYKDIIMSGISKYGINVQQDYVNGSGTGVPKDNIPITRLTLNNVRGKVASYTMPVYIFCGPKGCSNWTWSQVSIEGSSKRGRCNYVPSGYSC